MGRNVIDLPRARAALARLDALAAEHPEAFDPNRINGSGGAIETLAREDAIMTGRPRTNPDGFEVYSLRLSPSDIERLKRLAARIPGASPRPLARDLLLKALTEAEREYSGHGSSGD